MCVCVCVCVCCACVRALQYRVIMGLCRGLSAHEFEELPSVLLRDEGFGVAKQLDFLRNV